MKRIWIVTELFYPEETSTSYILAKVANRLVKDAEVGVICGPEQYDSTREIKPDASFAPDERITILRQSAFKLNKNRLTSRLLRQIVLSVKMTVALLRRIHRGDNILIVTNPAPLMMLAAMVKRWKKNKLFVLVHDVFPENTIPAGVLKSERSITYRLLLRLFRKAYGSADVLITIGRDMQKKVKEKLGENKHDTEVVVVENWADTDAIHPQRRDDNGVIEIQYAGNVGRVQGLDEFIDTFIAADNQLLRLSIWGDGASRKRLEEKVRESGCKQIEFHGSYHRDEQERILNTCDIALVSLTDGMLGLGVPSKSYNIMAAGKPLLYIGDRTSEIALMTEESGCGYVFDSFGTELKEWLHGLSLSDKQSFSRRGLKARELAESKYSEEAILEKFSKIII